MKITFKARIGYWDLDNYPWGGNFKRLKQQTTFTDIEVIDKYNDDSPRKIIATQDGHKLGLTIDQLSTV